eukprot:jgi/Psemu1/199320/e_gw1.235.20.1
MAVVNFNLDEVRASNEVKRFYKSLEDGGQPYTKTWCDTIADFDNEITLKHELQRRFKQEKCRFCNAPCIVRRVKRDNGNKGRWFITCSSVNSNSRQHRFEWITIQF